MKMSMYPFSRSHRKTIESFILAVFSACITGQTLAVPITQIESWPGYTRHLPQQVCAAASNAYLTTTGGLQILDLSDPDQPDALSFLALHETWQYPTDIHLLAESNRLSIGIGVSYGAHVNTIKGIDTANPEAPELVWEGSLYHRPNTIYQDGGKVYSSHNLKGLTVSTWGVPGYGFTPSTVANATGRVAASGTRLFVPTGSGFIILNKNNHALLGTYDGGAQGHDIEQDGLLVYLAAADGMHIVNLDSEAAPERIGFLPLPSEFYNPTAIELVSDYACMIFSNTNSLMMVNISTPDAPTTAGSFAFTGPVKGLSVSGSRAYVLAADTLYGSSDLHILDLADPGDISRMSRLYASGSATQLDLKNKTLFLADAQNGLCVFNTDLSPLSVIGQNTESISALAIDGNRVYAGGTSGLGVIDVTIPETPVTITNLFDSASLVAVGDDAVYWIVGWGSGFLITDKSDQLNELSRLYWIDGISQVKAFDTANDLYALFVDDFQNNLVVIDLEDAALPILTNYQAAVPIVDVAASVTESGAKAFLATTNGMEVMDLSNKDHFTVTGSWECPSGFVPHRIRVDGNRAVLAAPNHLWVLNTDALNGGDPLIAETEAGIEFSDMILSGDLLYAAAGADGIWVYRIGEDLAQPTLSLSIIPSNHIQLDWDDAGTGWRLQHSQELTNSSGWTSLPGTETVTTTNIAPLQPVQYFRLKK